MFHELFCLHLCSSQRAAFSGFKMIKLGYLHNTREYDCAVETLKELQSKLNTKSKLKSHVVYKSF